MNITPRLPGDIPPVSIWVQVQLSEGSWDLFILMWRVGTGPGDSLFI